MTNILYEKQIYYIVNAEHYKTFLLTMSRLYAFTSGKAAPAYTCVLSVFEGH